MTSSLMSRAMCTVSSCTGIAEHVGYFVGFLLNKSCNKPLRGRDGCVTARLERTETPPIKEKVASDNEHEF